MKDGDKVKIHYTGSLSDGKVFDSSTGKEPLEFTLGAKQVIPGFEKAVSEMKPNEEKTVTIKADEAYGQKNEQLVKEIPKAAIKSDQQVQVGGKLMLKSPEGKQFPAVVSEVKKEVIKIDLNHPLAGKDLTFKIKVVAVN
jgi:peptidylprolyl isomerase